MGLRTLIELNHDSVEFNLSSAMADKVMADLRMFIASGDDVLAANLYVAHDIKVVATRHSSDKYYISRTENGFPARLPYEEEEFCVESQRNDAMAYARVILESHPKSRVTKADLLDIISALIAPKVEND